MIGSLIQAGPILDDLPPFSKGINGRDLEMLHTLKTLSISRVYFGCEGVKFAEQQHRLWKQVDKKGKPGKISAHAEVAELADALRSGRSGGSLVWVQIPPSAQELQPLPGMMGEVNF